MEKEKTIAQKLHDAYDIIHQVQEVILDAFETHEPDTDIDFTISSDWYDNSIEIYFKNILPYPYEPCWEIRDKIYALGFSIVYWNFIDEQGNYSEEIRGSEPRRYKKALRLNRETKTWKACSFGYVDERFNEQEWLSKYGKKKQVS